MAEHNELGEWGEELAAQYLMKKGYFIKDRNWRLGHCDLDIVAVTPDLIQLVFVEVKTRSNDDIIDPTAAVTPQKMRHIGRCANAYLKIEPMFIETRFDVITIVGKNADDAIIKHYEDAFNPCLL